MKKFLRLLVFVVIVAFSSSIAFAQNRESCVKYDATRTLEGFKQVILTWKDPFISSQLWPAYAERANAILQTSKKEEVRKIVITPDLKGMTWLMEHSFRHERSHFIQEEYYNGVRINNDLVFLSILGQPSDWVVMEYEDVMDMYAKIACCNAQKPKIPVVAYVPPTPTPTPTPVPVPAPTPAPAPAPVQRVDTVKTVYITEYREVERMIPQQPIQYGYRQSRISVNIGMQQRPMYQQQPMRQQMAYRPQQRQNYRPQQPQRPTYQPRRMPPAIPSINQPTYNQPTYNPGSGGGIDSSPRSMPPRQGR